MHGLDVNTRNLKTQTRQGDGFGALMGSLAVSDDLRSQMPVELAIAAVSSTESAMSCIDDRLRPIFVAIQVMASQRGLSDKEKSTRLDDVARLAKAGLGIADDMTLTLDAAMESFTSGLEGING